MCAGQILTKLEKRELLMTNIGSVGNDDKNKEMVKGKLKKSFKNCVRCMKYSQDLIVVWGADLSLKSACFLYRYYFITIFMS